MAHVKVYARIADYHFTSMPCALIPAPLGVTSEKLFSTLQVLWKQIWDNRRETIN